MPPILRVTGHHRGPRNHIPLRHFLEQFLSSVDETALGVGREQRVVHGCVPAQHFVEHPPGFIQEAVLGVE
uniref:Uncharacterized protein n=1 Tax=Arundo donax TaxID=35708 RepID=A0A0A9D6Q9_ARUDO